MVQFSLLKNHYSSQKCPWLWKSLRDIQDNSGYPENYRTAREFGQTSPRVCDGDNASLRSAASFIAATTGEPYNGVMDSPNKKPIIVGFVADLMFNTQIENVARRLGYEMRWIERPSDLAPAEPDAPEERPGELLHGQGGALFSKMSAWQPALLVFDLDNNEIPWRQWIASLKSSAATRRVPILCFGSHVNTESLRDADRMGAESVVARSRFSQKLPDLIEQVARTADRAAIDEACAEPISELAAEGIKLFNQGHYYKCHDSLEEAWMADESVGRDLYRGILQVGIAYFQIERGNYRGALKMLLRVRQWLAPLPDVCRGVHVARLREDVDRVQRALEVLGPDAMNEIDRQLFREIELV